jgi:alkaline phosphatase D
MKHLTIIATTCVLYAASALAAPPYMATGIKIGEVTDSAAIVWVRLTSNEERVDFGAPMPEVSYTDAETGQALDDYRYRDPGIVPSVSYPEGSSINTIEGAVPGAEGFARVYYKGQGERDYRVTAWKPVDPEADFTRQFRLVDLKPGTEAEIPVRGIPDCTRCRHRDSRDLYRSHRAVLS